MPKKNIQEILTQKNWNCDESYFSNEDYLVSYEKDNPDSWRDLIVAVFLQALSDYQIYLEKREKKNTLYNEKNIKELEDFFQSDWCKNLLQFYFDGQDFMLDDDILKNVQTYVNKKISNKERRKERIK